MAEKNLGAVIYKTLFKRTSTFAVLAIFGAFCMEGIIDYTAEEIFNSYNRGKLWHHIRDNYNKADE